MDVSQLYYKTSHISAPVHWVHTQFSLLEFNQYFLKKSQLLIAIQVEKFFVFNVMLE